MKSAKLLKLNDPDMLISYQVHKPSPLEIAGAELLIVSGTNALKMFFDAFTPKDTKQSVKALSRFIDTLQDIRDELESVGGDRAD